MRWSISKSKIFSQCQRRWYFSDVMASHGLKNAERREVYLLKQLQSVFAWRGSLVDKVIELAIVPQLNKGIIPTKEDIITYAHELFEKQLAFGKECCHLQEGMTKTKAKECFCAFYDIEYNGDLDETQIEKARDDVDIALTNLIESSMLPSLVEDKPYLVAQRHMSFHFEEDNVMCTPDLIALYPDKAPMIVDWKVHSFGNNVHWLQLGVYGLALSRIKPHSDFPDSFPVYVNDPTQIKLIEYQLLSNTPREYKLTKQDLIDIEDYIFKSLSQMNRLVEGKKHGQIDINTFQTAQYPEICGRCQFKKICWSDDDGSS